MKALVLKALGHGFDYEDVEIAASVGREVGRGRGPSWKLSKRVTL